MSGRPRASWRLGLGALALVLALGAGAAQGAGGTALSIRVVGDHFVGADGGAVRLLGVDEESTEYACYYGYAYANVPLSPAGASVIASWGADAVRIPLNEDCWLGINGMPAGGLTAAGYRSAVEGYVAALGAAGIYAILDLHWSAPGAVASGAQRPMPDDHSAAFWTSVAGAFVDDPAVVFDAFNEPYSPAADGWSGYPVSWSCWEDGGCSVPDDADGTPPHAGASTYTAVGMQALVNAIRATGATQPIMLGGLSYANDLSGWLAHEPVDPDHQLVASFHNYTGEQCSTIACWRSQIAPVAAAVPVVTGEFGEDDCPVGGGANAASFDNTYMDWADANGVSYLGWGWLVLDGGSPPPCSALTLLDDYDGTPADPNGVALRDHLLGLGADAVAVAPSAAGTGATSVGGSSAGGGGTGVGADVSPGAGAATPAVGATGASGATGGNRSASGGRHRVSACAGGARGHHRPSQGAGKARNLRTSGEALAAASLQYGCHAHHATARHPRLRAARLDARARRSPSHPRLSAKQSSHR